MSSPSDIVRKYIRPGDRVGGRYQIEGFIGSGAYGAIFSAIDVETMERVAVKALPPAEDGTNKTAIGRFQREMKVISRLRHPNIITMYDFGETEHRIVYMVMEYIEGETLFDLCNQNRLDDTQALHVVRQIASALNEAHTKGVIHRDLKPQNVMVAQQHNGQYVVKVLDFGMAKLLSGGDDSSIVQLTREGVAVGTPRYIAPEQARGKDVGPWSDLYALGLLMYEAFTGERAVKADTIESAIIAHVSPEPLELQEIDDVPQYVRPVLFKLIEKKIKRRYQSAGEVVRDLDNLDRRRNDMEIAPTLPFGSDKLELDFPEPRQQTAEKSARLKSINSADNLELDYDRYGKYAPAAEHVPQQRPRRKSEFNFRMPHHVFEFLEAFAAFMLAPAAFVLFTAHFEGMDYFLRLFIGILPLVIAIVVNLSVRSTDWMFSFFRLFFMANILTLVLAHLMGVEDLANGLLRNPDWLFKPFVDLPGGETLSSMMRSFSRTYASIWRDLPPGR